MSFSAAQGLVIQALRQIFIALRSATAKDTAWVFASNIGSKALALVSFVILTRALGPEQYGVFSLAIVVLSMATDLSDLGINASAIRYGAEYAGKADWDSLALLYSVVIRSRLVMCVTVAVVGILASPFLARVVFDKSELTVHLQLAFAGIFGTLIYSALAAILQAVQRFKHLMVASIAYGAFNLGGVAVLSALGVLSPLNALVVNLVAPLVGTVAVLMMIPRHLLTWRLWDARHGAKAISLWQVDGGVGCCLHPAKSAGCPDANQHDDHGRRWVL